MSLIDFCKSSIDRKSIVVFNLPKEPEIAEDLVAKLKNLCSESDSFLFALTEGLEFTDSCHMCQLGYRDLNKHEFCVLISVVNDNYDELIDAIRSIDNQIESRIICEAKLNKDSICPLMMKEEKEKCDLKEKLIEIIESWFSDEEIFKHKDILVSMSNHGWVELSVLEAKLDEMIVIGADEMIEKLRKSTVLEIDQTNRFVRRVKLELPDSIEHRQIVLLDIPDTIKSIRQLPAFLQFAGSKAEYFEYGIHAAIVTLETRSDAIKLLEEIRISGKMKGKLLVPSLELDGTDLKENEELEDPLDVGRMLGNLSVKETPIEYVHVMRLAPHELSYTFPPDFQPPSEEMINQIVKQCNFYFSDSNVLKDLFILKKIKSNPGGWMNLKSVANFKQMVKLSNNSIDNVIYAMCFSDQVQISRDASNLRRRLPLPQWDASIYIRSLFLWNLPKSCETYEVLDQVFRDEGRFDVRVSRFIRSERNVPADLRKLCDKIPALGKLNCGVVEFGSRESMIAADDFIHLKWASVKTFYLDTKEELPKPAVIIGKVSKCLPPPLPISSFIDKRVTSLQAGTLIDPRFWQVARLLSAKKRTELKIYNPNKSGTVEMSPKTFKKRYSKDFPPLNSDKSHKNKERTALQSIENKDRKSKFPKNNNKKKNKKPKNPSNVENSEPLVTSA